MTEVHEGINEWNRIELYNEFVSRTNTAKHTDRETRSPRVSRIASSSGGRGGDVGSSAMAEKSLRLGIFHYYSYRRLPTFNCCFTSIHLLTPSKL